MVVLAAAICTKSGKAVVSRQFRDMARSRVEALIASFPKLADTSTQHTVVEQDSVRFIYQPLDELYMLLITNKQSNILQDIDTLHIFAQVVTSTCKSLEEREIIRNAYELLSAFDELVTLGYRENLTISQIKAFLEMESHEERIQEIISRNKELEATEERKRKAKQLDMQRKEATRSGMGRGPPRTPVYPTYSAPARPAVTETYDSYEAEKNKSYKTSAPKGKGMQLGKKSKTTDMFERVRGDMGAEVEESSSSTQPPPTSAEAPSTPGLHTSDHDGIQVTIVEAISAQMSREGVPSSIEIKGDLQLRISDQSLTRVKLDLVANASHEAAFKTHPNVDKPLFNTSKVIQMRDTSRSFPVNISVGVLKWRAAPKAPDASALPITFTAFIDGIGDEPRTITIQYELAAGEELRDVSVTIPYSTSEPAVSSFDATYEVAGDSLEWSIGSIDESTSTGEFQFEAQTEDVDEFFPMQVKFSKTRPFIDVDVTSVTLLEMNEDVSFTKNVRSTADSYLIE